MQKPHPDRSLCLKAKALSPPTANQVEDLDNILTDWAHSRHHILEEEPGNIMSDEALQTSLSSISPQELARDMRRAVTYCDYTNGGHGFGQ